MERYVGLDIGGTSIKMGIINHKGEVLYAETRSSKINHYQVPLIEVVKEAVKALKIYLRKNKVEVKGAGVSAAGQIDGENGVVIGTCGNIPEWEGVSLRNTIAEILETEVVVANDGNCMALGEYWVGSGKGYQNIIAYTIGTGIGGGIIIDGRIFSGSNGIAGEIGHMILKQNGRLCTCGNGGCFEQYASMSALIRTVKKTTGREFQDGKEIFAAAKRGDPEIKKCLDQFLAYNAAGIASLVHIFNPQVVIVGGGVSEQGEYITRPLAKKVKEMVMPAFAERLVLTTAKLGNKAGMIGAVKNFMEKRS